MGAIITQTKTITLNYEQNFLERENLMKNNENYLKHFRQKTERNSLIIILGLWLLVAIAFYLFWHFLISENLIYLLLGGAILMITFWIANERFFKPLKVINELIQRNKEIVAVAYVRKDYETVLRCCNEILSLESEDSFAMEYKEKAEARLSCKK